MSDRLAEIAPRLRILARHLPADTPATLPLDLALGLIEVAKAARDYEAKTARHVRIEIYNSAELSDSHEALRDALANLEGAPDA